MNVRQPRVGAMTIGKGDKAVITQPMLLRVGVVSGLALGIDQLSKALVRQMLAVCPANTPHLSACAHRVWFAGLWLVRVRNAGADLGYAQGLRLWVLLAAASILLIPLYGWRLQGDRWLAGVALGLQLGGALGNLVDRLAFGGVTDWIFPGHWAVFNLADVALAIGIPLAVWCLLPSVNGQAATAAGVPTNPTPPDWTTSEEGPSDDSTL